MTDIARVLNWIRSNPGIDDDRLREETEVSPRSRLVEICDELERRGFIERRKCDGGLIHNCPVAWIVSSSDPLRRKAVLVSWGETDFA